MQQPVKNPYAYFKNIMLFASFVAFISILFFETDKIYFFPSALWGNITQIFSLIPALFGAVASFRYIQYTALKGRGNIAIACLVIMGIFWYSSYVLLAFLAGGVTTGVSGYSLEKDITGIKIKEFLQSAYQYYVDTPDLPKGGLAKLYIHRDEYDRIQDPVKMHLYCKESFFGLLVDHYTFTNQPALAQ